MQELDLSPAVALIKQMATCEFDAEIESAEVEDVLRAVLFEPRNLWRATQSGLVTRAETANAVAAHVHRWLLDRSGRSWGPQDTTKWDGLIEAVEAALPSAK